MRRTSFTYAFEGLAWAFTNHPNFQIHTVIALSVLSAALFLGVSRFELSVLIFAIIQVFVVEMVNTAIEEITDLVTVKWAHQAKVAKDVAAGMVLLTSIAAAVVGIIIFTPYILPKVM